MKASEITGRAVVTLSNAEKVGHVDDVLFDADYRRIVGFRIKRGAFSRVEAVPRESVTAVGQDAVTVSGPDAINAEDRFGKLAGAASLDQARKTKVVTESGTLVGLIGDVALDDEARTVHGYLLSVSLLEKLRHAEREVAATEVTRLGESGIMIVTDAAGARLQQS